MTQSCDPATVGGRVPAQRRADVITEAPSRHPSYLLTTHDRATLPTRYPFASVYLTGTSVKWFVMLMHTCPLGPFRWCQQSLQSTGTLKRAHSVSARRVAGKPHNIGE